MTRATIALSIFTIIALAGCGEDVPLGGADAAPIDGAVDAAVDATPTFLVNVTPLGAGAGTITSSPAGIACGAACAHAFDVGTTVTLTVAAAPGSSFMGWSGGGCSGTGACVVTGPTTVTAAFALDGLTVTRSGSGAGTVTSSPAGINCGADCAEDYATGTAVTLVAVAAAGSTFAGWSGDCSGTGTCTVVISGAMHVDAAFVTATGPVLTITRSGAGTGTVFSGPAGITCGADCTETYPLDTAVALIAMPATGSTFVGWTGDCTGTGPCTVTMTGARNANAEFALLPAAVLTVTRSGAGTGTVTSAPAGISCGADCSESYPSTTAVTLAAAAASGSTFVGWSGAGCTGTGTCTVAVTSAVTVDAMFAPAAAGSLAVTRTGSGSGTVSSSPAGISCGAVCSATYASSTIVTLVATPDAGSTFTGWSGACTGTGACAVSITGAIAVSATFTLSASSATLTVVRAGAGSGTVTSAPAGINCGADCAESYNVGTVVTLVAVASAGSTFAGWTAPGCAATPTCAVVVNAPTVVTANFAP